MFPVMSGRPLVLVGLLKKTNATSRHCREGKKMNKIPQSECNGTTHSACKSRFEKEGGKTRCCYCVPHEDCDFNQPQTSLAPLQEDWEEWIHIGINSFISIDEDGNEYLNEQDIYNLKTHLTNLYRLKIEAMKKGLKT